MTWSERWRDHYMTCPDCTTEPLVLCTVGYGLRLASLAAIGARETPLFVVEAAC